MTRKTTLTAGLVALGLVAGAGGAVAATRPDDAAQREGRVLAAAAERLGVPPQRLRSALAAAQDEQLDADVRAGRLTREQADVARAHRGASGIVLGGPGGGHGGPGMRGALRPLLGGPPVLAKALGITEAQLLERLRDGATVAEIAKAEGKSVEQVRDALRSAARESLDAEVQAGRMTAAQRTEALEHLEEHLARLDEPFRVRGGRRGHGPHGFGG